MKYLSVRDLENVTSAMNFDTADCHVSGGCDLYITKAASRDKKLYKDIENTLESQHTSLVRLSKSLSPPHRELLNLHISNSSPFGPMNFNSSRRTFAYMIATLNASHPDYDFSDITKPADFRQEPSLAKVQDTINTMMYNLRPRTRSQLLAPPTRDLAAGPNTPGGTPTWSPRCWRAIDNQMTLKECEVYEYAPTDDPFDGEESAIWSHHYFFFNRIRKRVLYLYVRGVSILGHSPSHVTTSMYRPPTKRPRPTSSSSLTFPDAGASKRAKYWLGDRADAVEDGWTHHDDEIDDPGDDEVDAEDWLGSDPYDTYSDDDDNDEIEKALRGKGAVRGTRHWSEGCY